MNYYSFHISDWALHTSHLTLEEEAVYRRLLDFYYDTESAIPEETNPVIRRLRMGSSVDVVASILSEFFVLRDGFWHNKRADKEILAYHAKAETARTNGKSGGRPKKTVQENPEITNPVNSANPEITGSKANQEPLTINQEPLTNKDQKTCAPPAHHRPADDLFAKFWTLYPKKRDKAKAEKAFAKLKVTDDLFSQIMQGLAAQSVSHEWTKGEGEFVPLPTTWINGRRWEDEVKPASNVHRLPLSKHADFDKRDYHAGLTEREDGTHAF